MPSPRRHEIEIKLRVDDIAALRRKLRALRARSLHRVQEWNVLLDTPRQALRKQGKLLRLRLERECAPRLGTVRALLTYKGPGLHRRGKARPGAAPARYKIREEIETPVTNPARLAQVFGAVGLVPSFRYEKYRETYLLPGFTGLLVELDLTPIGVFLELEGPPRVIDRASRRLGFAPRDYLVSSYAGIYYAYCRRHHLPPGDMVFPNSKAG